MYHAHAQSTYVHSSLYTHDNHYIYAILSNIHTYTCVYNELCERQLYIYFQFYTIHFVSVCC